MSVSPLIMAGLNAQPEWLRQWRLRESTSSTLPIQPRLRTQHETDGEAAEYSSEAIPNAIGDISLTFLISKPSNLEIDVEMLRCFLNVVSVWGFEKIFGQAVLSQKSGCICVSNSSDCMALLLGLLHRNDA
jgi:hypothetical protein